MKTYQLISILEMSHILMNHVVISDSHVVDMTLGNGYDAEYLASICKHVYAFDISEEAIWNAKKRLADNNNVTIYHASHVDFKQYLTDISMIDLFVFNLGYLPGSNKEQTTTKETTMATLIPLFDCIKPQASILIVSYVGHDGGKEEYEAIREYCESIKEKAEIIQYEFLNAPKSAKIIMISKHKERTTK